MLFLVIHIWHSALQLIISCFQVLLFVGNMHNMVVKLHVVT
jgi:hypothetical protein